MAGCVKGDPYWIRARYPSTCRSCDERIVEGSRAFYWPKGGRLKLQCESCGADGERIFLAEIAGEVF
jgi:predicted RNA-binding Zn-ribbon protein involved in translation (DUF1610 family)